MPKITHARARISAISIVHIAAQLSHTMSNQRPPVKLRSLEIARALTPDNIIQQLGSCSRVYDHLGWEKKGTSDLFCKLGKYHNHVEEKSAKPVNSTLRHAEPSLARIYRGARALAKGRALIARHHWHVQ